MSDIFREVDEDIRRERFEEFWKKYGSWVIALVVVILAATGGWQAWNAYSQAKAREAGAKYEDAVAMARDGKSEDARKALEALLADAPGGYHTLTRFRLASEQTKQDPPAGLAAWKALAADAGLGKVMQDLARIRAALIEVDTLPYAQMSTSLESLTALNNPWRNQAREILAVSALKANDMANAAKWLDLIVVDRNAPAGLRQRAEQMLGLMRGGPVAVQ